MEILLDVKPLSTNCLFKGRKYRTDKYDKYEAELLSKLPKNIPVGNAPYRLNIEFGTGKLQDIDNNLKGFLDVICKHLKINDRDIYQLHVNKVLVKKTKEYVKFELVSI